MTGRPDQSIGQKIALAGIGQALVLAAALIPQHVWAQGSPQSPTRPAAQAITEYMGGGYLTVSDSCADYGWSGVHQVMMRFQPQGEPGNMESETQLALYMSTGVIAIRYDSTAGVQNTGVPLTQATYVWNGPWSPDEPAMTISHRTRYGDGLHTENRDRRSVYFSLGNFNEHPGCIAALRVSIGRN